MSSISSIKLTTEIIQMMQRKACKMYGHSVIKRSAHTASLATLKGSLKIEESLPKEIRVGFFKESATYPIWIRISNSNTKIKNDTKKDVRGLAIQMNNKGQLQDFILVSTKYMPLRDLKAFHAIISLSNGGHPIKSIMTLLAHINLSSTLKLLLTLKHESSPLDIPYFSITPYRCGNHVVKYSLIPTSSYKSKRPIHLTSTYLKDNMKRHLTNHPATFDLMIQVQRQGMSIEDASKIWNEKKSPLIKVGEITIRPQQFDNSTRRQLGEQLTFSPAHSLKVHSPVGTLNTARIIIYNQMQKFRKGHRY